MTDGKLASEFKVDRGVLEDLRTVLHIELPVTVVVAADEVQNRGEYEAPTEDRQTHVIRVDPTSALDAANESLMHELAHARQWEENSQSARGDAESWERFLQDQGLPYASRQSEREADAVTFILARKFDLAVPARSGSA